MNDTVEIGGPEQFGLDEIARMHMTANEDTAPLLRMTTPATTASD
ncbi:hypothetical protein [Rhizobium sp. IBUN]|nr:hypothetical protein [Rhizobium sp. IBUN]